MIKRKVANEHATFFYCSNEIVLKSKTNSLKKYKHFNINYMSKKKIVI